MSTSEGRRRALRGQNLVAALALSGCSGLLGIDVPPENTSTGGAAGKTGETGAISGQSTGGTPTAGAGGGSAGLSGGSSPLGRGGAGGNAGTGGAKPTGGVGGGGQANGGTFADAGGSQADAGAAGGDEPSVPPVRPTFGAAGNPCEVPGWLTCDRAGRTRAQLICEDGSWAKVTAQCPQGTTCDHRTGACGTILSECSGKNPGDSFCEKPLNVNETPMVSFTCGPDLVSISEQYCDLDCDVDTGRCNTPGQNTFLVEQPPKISGNGVPWPLGPIRVCFEPESSSENRALVRDEIERSWARYTALDFLDWDDCREGESGVIKVHFDEICNDVLASINRFGYPGSEANSEVGICLKRQRGTAVRAASPALIRILARHEFLHVLGFDHTFRFDASGQFFSSYLDAENPNQPPAHVELSHLQWVYGMKPSRTLATHRGHCIELSETPSTTSCAAPSAQTWAALGDQVIHTPSGECLSYGADSDPLTEMATCSSAPQEESRNWRFSNVHVRTLGGLCFEANDSVLAVSYCKDFNTQIQLFEIEPVEAGRRVRIRRPGNLCATGDDNTYLVWLKTCDECDIDDDTCPAQDRFEITAQGQLAWHGRCLRTPTWTYKSREATYGDIRLDHCISLPPYRFALSGLLKDETGAALTPSTESGALPLTAEAADHSLTSPQVFDYHF